MRQCLRTKETPGELPGDLLRNAELLLSFGPTLKRRICLFLLAIRPKRQMCRLAIWVSIPF